MTPVWRSKGPMITYKQKSTGNPCTQTCTCCGSHHPPQPIRTPNHAVKNIPSSMEATWGKFFRSVHIQSELLSSQWRVPPERRQSLQSGSTDKLCKSLHERLQLKKGSLDNTTWRSSETFQCNCNESYSRQGKNIKENHSSFIIIVHLYYCYMATRLNTVPSSDPYWWTNISRYHWMYHRQDAFL